MTRPIHVFSPHQYWGKGPPATCYRIAAAWAESGQAAAIYTSIVMRPDPAGLFRPAVPSLLPMRIRRRIAGMRRLREPLHRRAEARGLAAVRPGDVCFFWPGADTAAIEAARRRGGLVVLEFINTHVGNAKTILDAECERIGAPRYHRLTEAAIEAENERIALAHAAFAPGPFVESSIRGNSPSLPVILDTSYGAYLPGAAPPDRRERPRLRFVFVGTIGVRKGVHTLIEAWRLAGLDATLDFAGSPEPWIAERYLADPPPGVRHLGYVQDVGALYRDADVFVFPSLEEGGPQVTYEAAGHGLPSVVTPMGGGRIARDRRNALVVPPSDAEALAVALTELARDAELRAELGAAAREDAARYDWSVVGRQRLAALGTLAASARS